MPVEVLKEVRLVGETFNYVKGTKKKKKKNHHGGRSQAYKENSKEGPIYIFIIKEKGY